MLMLAAAPKGRKEGLTFAAINFCRAGRELLGIRSRADSDFSEALNKSQLHYLRGLGQVNTT